MADLFERETCNCDRCGRPCRTAEKQNPDAQPIRKSLIPKGCCVDCAITCFVRTGPLGEAIGATSPREALSLPHVQAQFAAVFRAGGCAEVSEEIDWDRVIENWELHAPPGWDWEGELYMSGPRKPHNRKAR